MKTNDYVKYMTQTFMKYLDQPKEERKKLREERKDGQASFLYRWFGILPYLLVEGLKKKK